MKIYVGGGEVMRSNTEGPILKIFQRMKDAKDMEKSQLFPLRRCQKEYR